MSDLKTIMSNLAFQLENTLDILRKTFLQCIATFLVWFSIMMAIAMAILFFCKAFKIWII